MGQKKYPDELWKGTTRMVLEALPDPALCCLMISESFGCHDI